MTDTIAGTPTAASRTHRRTPEFPIGDPVATAWREDVLTRAKELDSLRACLLDAGPADADDPWWTAIREHLDAVEQAAEGRRGRRAQFHRLWASVTGSTIGRAMSNLDAASKAALREQLRVRSFRNVLIVTPVVMTLIAVGIAVLGFISPSLVPLCFQPVRSGQTVVVCPTGRSALFDTGQESGPATPDVDDVSTPPWRQNRASSVSTTASRIHRLTSPSPTAVRSSGPCSAATVRPPGVQHQRRLRHPVRRHQLERPHRHTPGQEQAPHQHHRHHPPRLVPRPPVSGPRRGA